ncbi:hypothetical protein FACUT_2908 [Fusarium acutatum]|uniref:Uncharacterized protein n=1 Tax=Fusarium acutatum TaxID=78861 RepID=A0A8H4JZJ8_9HYPO|nr:hypothetical protein FACUT_2908 [Fusarium acutatum]
MAYFIDNILKVVRNAGLIWDIYKGAVVHLLSIIEKRKPGSKLQYPSTIIKSKMVHRITFTVNNQTPYYLIPNGQYAYWGETNSGPDIINPYRTGSGGVFQASAVPWVGSAGISGYTIANPAIWIAMLGSDPDWSAEDNSARVAMSTTALTTHQDLYNNMYSANVTSLTLPTANGHIKLTCNIGSADDTVASFQLTFDRGTGVTDEALGVVVPEEK